MKQEEFSPRVDLKGWKHEEIRTFKFLDNGKDHNHAEYGLAYIYQVMYEKEKRSLWVKPRSPLAIGLQAVVNQTLKLDGLTVSIQKIVGARQKDTRYNCVVE